MSAAPSLRSSAGAPPLGVAAGRRRRARRTALGCGVLALVALALVVVSLTVGSTVYSPLEVLRVMLGETVPGASFTVGTLRLPRTLTAVLVGLGCAVYVAAAHLIGAFDLRDVLGLLKRRRLRRAGGSAISPAPSAER